jgi:hypothetical protein
MLMRLSVLLCLPTLIGCVMPRPPSATGPAPVSDPVPGPVRGVAPDGGMNAMIRSARDDAARRTGLPPESLELVSAEAVTWRDGSLGCPQPGMAYTMALVPGYRIRLRAQGQLLDYHAGRQGAPALCPAGRAIDPVVDDRL